MTLSELSKIVGIAEGTLKNQFKREAERLAKKGIFISKTGRGKSVEYFIEYDELFNDNRANTIFEEEKANIYLMDDMLKMLDWNLLVFLGICLTPLLVFRGSYEDFLTYAGVTPSSANVVLLKEALKEMNDKYIGYYPDKTDDNYFTASIYKTVENELKVPIARIRDCRKIQLDTHSRSFIPILKVWMATEEAIKNQPYTIQDLSDMTGLSPSTVKRVNKQLKDNNIYISKKDYNPSLGVSRGVSTVMNGFHE